MPAPAGKFDDEDFSDPAAAVSRLDARQEDAFWQRAYWRERYYRPGFDYGTVRCRCVRPGYAGHSGDSRDAGRTGQPDNPGRSVPGCYAGNAG